MKLNSIRQTDRQTDSPNAESDVSKFTQMAPVLCNISISSPFHLVKKLNRQKSTETAAVLVYWTLLIVFVQLPIVIVVIVTFHAFSHP